MFCMAGKKNRLTDSPEKGFILESEMSENKSVIYDDLAVVDETVEVIDELTVRIHIRCKCGFSYSFLRINPEALKNL